MNIADRVTKITSKRFYDLELGTDSLELMEYVMDLEDEFGINIPENKMAGVKTMADVIRMLEEWQGIAEDTAE